METIFTITQGVIASLLIISILLQQRGSGMSATLGGEASSYATRRGAEKIIFTLTIVFSILLLAVSIIRIITQ